MPYLRNKRTGEQIWVPDGPQMPADPEFQYKGPTAAAKLRGQELQNQETAATMGADVDLKKAQAAKARAEAQQASGIDNQKLANIRAAQAQVDRLRHLYGQSVGKTKGFAGVLDYLPTGKNQSFDTAGAGLGEVGLAAFRVPGVGSQSDTELRAFIDANRPSSWDHDDRIKEKLNNLQSRLDQTYSAYGLKRGSKGEDGWKIERMDD